MIDFNKARMEQAFRKGELDDLCDEVADMLTIDADGGDSAGAVVRGAFVMVLNEHAAKRAENRAAKYRTRS